jgi:hypothetical protein
MNFTRVTSIAPAVSSTMILLDIMRYHILLISTYKQLAESSFINIKHHRLKQE